MTAAGHGTLPATLRAPVRWGRPLLAVGTMAGVWWLAMRGVAWEELRAAARPRAAGWLVAAAMANLLVLPLWAGVWATLARVLARHGGGPTWRTLLPSAALSSTIMNTVPYGAGHAAAVALLAHRDGGGLGVRGAVAVLMLDQLVEGAAKGLVLALAAGVSPAPLPWHERMPPLATVATLLGGLALGAWALGVWARGSNRGVARRWTAHWRRARALLAGSGARRVAVRALLLAVASKAVEALAIACVWKGYALPLGWQALPAVLGTTLVAAMLPLAPANLGPYEAATAMAYQWFGVDRGTALAVALVQHAAFLLPAVGAGVVVLAAGGPLRRARPAWSATPERASPARAWGLLAAILAIYAVIPALHTLLANGSVRYWDNVVGDWELALFGTQPARHLAARLPGAWVRELLQLAYLAFYPLVVLPAAWLHLRGAREAFFRTMAALRATFLACYGAFVLFPVLGPRYLWADPPPGADSGPVAALARAILAQGSSPGTAFPSAHAALAVALAVMAWRTRALPAIPLTVLALALCAGAVAGGYHYAIDTIAGATVGLLMALAADRQGERPRQSARGDGTPPPTAQR